MASKEIINDTQKLQYFGKQVKLCENRNKDACSWLIDNINTQFEISSISLYEKACFMGVSKGCFLASELRASSSFLFNPIYEFYNRKRGCELGNSDLCNLYAFYFDGVDPIFKSKFVNFEFKTDTEKFKTILDKSCRLNNMQGCNILAYKYMQSKDYEDIRQAQAYLQKACLLNSTSACNMLNSLNEQYKE